MLLMCCVVIGISRPGAGAWRRSQNLGAVEQPSTSSAWPCGSDFYVRAGNVRALAEPATPDSHSQWLHHGRASGSATAHCSGTGELPVRHGLGTQLTCRCMQRKHQVSLVSTPVAQHLAARASEPVSGDQPRPQTPRDVATLQVGGIDPMAIAMSHEGTVTRSRVRMPGRPCC